MPLGCEWGSLMNKKAERELSDFLGALQLSEDFKTSYGDPVVLYSCRGMAREAFDKAPLREVFSAYVLGGSKEVDYEVKEFLRGLGEWNQNYSCFPVTEDMRPPHEGHRYYLKRTLHGKTVLECVPYAPMWNETCDVTLSLEHVPDDFDPRISHMRWVNNYPLKSVAEYRELMDLSKVQPFETQPKRLMNIGIACERDGRFRELHQQVANIFSSEWKRVAEKGESTPERYQALLSRIDPDFRWKSQELYARRERNGVCLGVSRNDGVYYVVIYVPDTFRFTGEESRMSTGMGGLMVNRGLLSREDLGARVAPEPCGL